MSAFNNTYVPISKHILPLALFTGDAANLDIRLFVPIKLDHKQTVPRVQYVLPFKC